MRRRLLLSAVCGCLLAAGCASERAAEQSGARKAEETAGTHVLSAKSPGPGVDPAGGAPGLPSEPPAVPNAAKEPEVWLLDDVAERDSLPFGATAHSWFADGADERERVDPGQPAGPIAAPRRAGNGLRVAVLQLGRPRHQADPGGYARNILGVHVTAEGLRRVGERLRQDRIDVVVLDVTLQGGYWSEAQEVQRVLTTEFLPHFRTVAWIDEAVGGAALALSVVPEVYFRPSGVYGPCPMVGNGSAGASAWIAATASSGGGVIEPLMESMKAACQTGKHDVLLFRAMMLGEPLSAIAGRGEGHIVLRAEELEGRTVNRTGHLLTLTATIARQVGFSSGTADEIDDLFRAMHAEGCELAGQEAAVALEFVAAQARTDESRLMEVLESLRSRILLTDSAIEGWERDTQADLALKDLDELEYLLSKNPLYRLYFADEARVPDTVGALNRIWFDAIRQGIDSLRRRELPLDEVAESVQM